MPQILNTAAIENDLRLEAQQPCGRLEWLEESYREPGEFLVRTERRIGWHASPRLERALCSASMTSITISSFATFNNPAPALSWYDLASGYRNISYKELGEYGCSQSRFLGPTWPEGRTIRSVSSGPWVLEMIVELLAALKIGCVFHFFLPREKDFCKRRLDVLQPDHIVVDTMHQFLVVRVEHKSSEGRHAPGYDLPSAGTVFHVSIRSDCFP